MYMQLYGCGCDMLALSSTGDVLRWPTKAGSGQLESSSKPVVTFEINKPEQPQVTSDLVFGGDFSFRGRNVDAFIKKPSDEDQKPCFSFGGSGFGAPNEDPKSIVSFGGNAENRHVCGPVDSVFNDPVLTPIPELSGGMLRACMPEPINHISFFEFDVANDQVGVC